MSPAQLLLKLYYERLYERLEASREALTSHIDELLSAEVAKQGFADMDEEKLAAYRDACIAFIDERLETYNPIGIQYTFGRPSSRLAAELEFQLNWYNSRPEFAELVATAQSLAAEVASDDLLPKAVEELIRRAGAFPDRSIIEAYHAAPALQKLPDYIVASAVEEVVCGRRPGK
jgi:DNA-binding Lrp family transcriptional regulator